MPATKSHYSWDRWREEGNKLFTRLELCDMVDTLQNENANLKEALLHSQFELQEALIELQERT